ncbi:hypothetical protein [Chitinophaga sancti]|uniref:Uncharacterized protein n=1 Tax=Chitinophaga sancti TaxID=1004 RepID=A0A1K1SXG1_9BACT|nr:hypothetical protein [Chitinophaga sancti]WQD63135.1 hypothetical protein U0033_01915 [Chitinophaga sancti]WQG91240.1 hypothetical protein SR876_07000 [Chitinophaga sancti]SFW88759.1 hypothetical protein SAMN05661012_06309 [Chitinophaga sancti]
MTRQITINLDGQQFMLDLEFEQRDHSIVYHVTPNKHFSDQIPAGFEMIQTDSDKEGAPTYDGSGLSEQGRLIAETISHQISQLPPQFRGGKPVEA